MDQDIILASTQQKNFKNDTQRKSKTIVRSIHGNTKH